MKTVDMLFKKEARFGEKLISQIEFKDENTTIHRLQNKDGEDLFLLQCQWMQGIYFDKTKILLSLREETKLLAEL